MLLGRGTDRLRSYRAAMNELDHAQRPEVGRFRRKSGGSRGLGGAASLDHDKGECATAL